MSDAAPPPPTTPPTPYGGAPRPARRNPLALWSLVLGFISIPLTCLNGLGAVLGVVAIVLGWRSRDAVNGRGMAIAGLVTGTISVVLIAVLLILYLTGAIANPSSGG